MPRYTVTDRYPSASVVEVTGERIQYELDWSTWIAANETGQTITAFDLGGDRGSPEQTVITPSRSRRRSHRFGSPNDRASHQYGHAIWR